MRSKPSKWCETTGTEHVGRLAATSRTVAAMSSGSGRRQEISEGEHLEDETHERRTNRDHLRMVDGESSATIGALKATSSPRRLLAKIHSNGAQGLHREQTLKAQSVTRKGHEGTRQTPSASLPSAVSWRRRVFGSVELFSTLKDRSTSQELSLLRKWNSRRYPNL